MFLRILIIVTFFENAHCQTRNISNSTVKFVFLSQNGDNIVSQSMSEVNTSNTSIDYIDYKVDEMLTAHNLCEYYKNGYTVIIDITWNNINSSKISSYAQNLKMLQLKVDFYFGAFLKITQSYLEVRNAKDVIILCENSENIERAYSYWINHPSVRFTILNGMSNNTVQQINKTLLVPSFCVFIGSIQNVTIMLKNLQSANIMRFPERLLITFLDNGDLSEVKSLLLGKPASLIFMDKKTCCQSQINCDKCPDIFNLAKNFLKNFVIQVTNIINDLNNDGLNILSQSPNCSAPNIFPKKLFYNYMNTTKKDLFTFDQNFVFGPQIEAILQQGSRDGKYKILGTYNSTSINGFRFEPGLTLKANKNFFHIATGLKTPWVFKEKDLDTGSIRLSGYCIDFINKLAEVMNFDYELEVTDDAYGEKQGDGSWDGLIGGLINGSIDFIIAPMTMTAEREEVVDFITPIFGTTGITTVIRRPEAKTSLFKFLTVFDLNVWLVVLGASIITALVLFILDYCSPYSSRNKQYSQPCRKFIFTECFWFVLTSFTPKGGGESPMALSGRILVGAYWIFVVLFLATFTAELSAFLTLERIQLQIRDYTLDNLVRQSKVNFTVVNNSWPMEYFTNMKLMEEEFSRFIGETAPYQIWSYPVEELYKNVLKSIYSAVPVENASQGYQKVEENTNGHFAFIHDYSEIRYEIARSCYLVEVGQPFAEMPYAVAVQQGSALRDEIGKVIQSLKKAHYFDLLQEKYYKKDMNENCKNQEISEGITVDDIGGIFIVTIFGILLNIILIIIDIVRFKLLNSENKIRDMEPEIFRTNTLFKQQNLFGNRFLPQTNNKMSLDIQTNLNQHSNKRSLYFNSDYERNKIFLH